MATKYEEQSPRQQRKKFLNSLVRVPNVQVIKTRKSGCQFSHGLCFVLVLDNFQFIREKDKMGYKR